MRMSLVLFVLSVMVGTTTAQQKNVSSPWQFHSVNNIGLLEGQTGSSFQLQTINGAEYKSWFGGVGLGLDFYRYRTIPVFIDLRKEFGKASNKLFVYSDLGVDFSWVTDNEKMNYSVDDQFGNGFYCDFGLGYKVAVGKHNNLLLSLGYSYKKLTETESYQDISFGYELSPGPNSQMEKMNYGLNRLSIKIGWEF
jgi:hypothetical protein